MTAGCFATLVTPFLITFNNHTLGTFSVLFALAALLAIWESKPGVRDWHHYLLAGLFAAFAVANELPALAFASAAFALLLWRAPLKTMLFFVPPAVLVAAGFLVTNYLAVDQWRPAYSEFGSPWYEYEGSHWRKPAEGRTRSGIDFARYHETRATYAFHLLAGHHGFFLLTPLWILATFGMVAGLRCSVKAGADSRDIVAPLPWFLPVMTLLVSLVVIVFYLVKSDNYGGWSVGPCWLIWLMPLFAADLAAGRGLG